MQPRHSRLLSDPLNLQPRRSRQLSDPLNLQPRPFGLLTDQLNYLIIKPIFANISNFYIMSLNPLAKQIPEINISRMDVATLLSFTNTVKAKGDADATMKTKMGTIWTAFADAATHYDAVYNPSRKDLLSDVLYQLDIVRDKSVTAYHTAILALLKSPNQQKKWIAQQLVQLYKDYHLEVSDEYMKQTTNVRQMLQVIQADSVIMSALPSMGLDDYIDDMNTKNEAFAAKMDERTTATIGNVDGTLSSARTDVVQKYRSLVRMVNVVNAYEGDGVLDQFILVMISEIAHYKDILARKGGSSASISGTGGGSSAGSGSTDSGDSGDTGDTGTSGSSSEGSGTGSEGSDPGTTGSDTTGGSGSGTGSGGTTPPVDDSGDGME